MSDRKRESMHARATAYMCVRERERVRERDAQDASDGECARVFVAEGGGLERETHEGSSDGRTVGASGILSLLRSRSNTWPSVSKETY